MSSTNNTTTRNLVIAVSISLAACLVWIATTPKLYRNGTILGGDALAAASSHRLLYSILEEDHQVPDLFPFLATDYFGFVGMVLGLILAAGAGIGGGGLLVPIFILVFGFCIKHAIPLASVTVLGGAIANNLLNANKCHPEHPSRPAIDWDLIIQLEPMTLAGALIGAGLNDLLPPEVLVILLFLLLSLTAYKTLKKARKLHDKETEEFLKAQQEAIKLLASGGHNHNIKDVEGAATSHNVNCATKYGSVSNENNGNEAIVRVLGAQPSFGADQVEQAFVSAAQLTALFAVVTVLNLLKGGRGQAGGGPVGLELCGERCFWITEVVIFVVIIVFAIWTRRNILNRLSFGGPVLSEIEWDEENTIKYPLYAVLAGLVAGMFGVGGGIIKGPLMLALGVHPAVAAATSACMILFTSSTATISYCIFDLLIYDYAGGCLVVGFVATLVGQTLMNMVMRKYNRNSYIAYTIGFVVGLSAVAMTVESVLAIVG